jgi:hypothetical protein
MILIIMRDELNNQKKSDSLIRTTHITSEILFTIYGIKRQYSAMVLQIKKAFLRELK